MRYAYSIVMFCFAGAILLYAALMSPGNAGMIRRAYAAKMRNPKAYAKKFAKVLALVSLAPLVCGLTGLFVDMERYPFVPVATLIVVFILCMRKGIRLMDDEWNDTHQTPDKNSETKP